MAQEEYEEANDEQGRQNNRCISVAFLLLIVVAIILIATFDGIDSNRPSTRKSLRS